MKNFLKKCVNSLVDVIFLPFETIYTFVKKADSVLYLIIRLMLIIILFILITYTFVAKPYNRLLKGFYFEKYVSGDDAKTSLLTIYPLENSNLKVYLSHFETLKAKCEENSDGKGVFYDCFYHENQVYKRYKWGVFIRSDAKKEKVKLLTISKKQVNNSFVEFYKVAKKRVGE